MHLFYWLVNDLIKVPVKNPDFKEFTPFEWKIIKQEFELPIGQIQKEFYERINPFFGSNKVRCKVIDIDHAEDEITVDNNGLIEIFNIQETNVSNINDIRLGDEISCSRMVMNPNGVYGNKSTLLINRNQSLEIPEDFVIGVEQYLPRKVKNKKIKIKYKVNIKDDFIISNSLDELDNLFKPDGASDKKYLSNESINFQNPFAEYYTTPDFSNSFVFDYSTTTVTSGGVITGTEPYLRNGLVHNSINYITNFYDSFVTNFGFPENNETYNIDTKVLDFYFWTGNDENVPVMKTVNITFSGNKTAQELTDEINTAIIAFDPNQDFCKAEVEIVGIRQRPIIKSKYNLYISSLTADEFGIPTNSFAIKKVVLNAEQISNKINKMKGSITDDPQINIVSKLLRNTFDTATYGNAVYSISNESSKNLYINKLDRYDEDKIGWQSIVTQMAKELVIKNYMTETELHDAFENYYQYYISQYNVWRSFEGLCYDFFDAFEITVSHGKIEINITEVVIDWIQNPYINYIAQLNLVNGMLMIGKKIGILQILKKLTI